MRPSMDMASGLLCILLVLSSTNSWMLVGGQTCSLSGSYNIVIYDILKNDLCECMHSC